MEIDQLLVIGFIALFAAASGYFQLLKPSGAVAAFLTGMSIWAGFGLKGLFFNGSFLSHFQLPVQV